MYYSYLFLSIYLFLQSGAMDFSSFLVEHSTSYEWWYRSKMIFVKSEQASLVASLMRAAYQKPAKHKQPNIQLALLCFKTREGFCFALIYNIFPWFLSVLQSGGGRSMVTALVIFPKRKRRKTSFSSSPCEKVFPIAFYDTSHNPLAQWIPYA